MKTSFAFAGIALLALNFKAIAAGPALTIYNQNFAVVRDNVPLDLKAGVNEVRFAGMTATAETDSVILRDPSTRVKLQVLEQSYRNDPVSAELLLNLNEGRTIDFLVHESSKPDRVVQGKIIRAGHSGPQYAQMAEASDSYHRIIRLQRPQTTPIIEVDNKLQFSLPGEPVFPSLGDDTILNPTLSWKLESSKAAKFDAEIAYITDGLSWHADYNLVVPENGDTLDLVGWVTFDNQSGKTFRDAKIKLMAGDVNRLEKVEMEDRAEAKAALQNAAAAAEEAVTEKAFSEFHLYTIGQLTTLRDQETKQVEFVRAQGVKAPRIFIYDGASENYNQYEPVTGSDDYGIPVNKKIWVLREFKNSEANHLGMPLPKGRLRFYQQDDDKQLEFIGENEIDHTPKDETIRVYVGNSFDLTGERRRTEFLADRPAHRVDETFEIKLRNHKKEAVEIRVVEHLARYDNWKLDRKADEYTKLDSHTVEFRVKLKPDEENTLTYRVHYTW